METDGRSNQLGPNYVQVWAALKTDYVQTNPRKNCLCGPTNISAIEITKKKLWSKDDFRILHTAYAQQLGSKIFATAQTGHRLVAHWPPFCPNRSHCTVSWWARGLHANGFWGAVPNFRRISGRARIGVISESLQGLIFSSYKPPCDTCDFPATFEDTGGCPIGPKVSTSIPCADANKTTVPVGQDNVPVGQPPTGLARHFDAGVDIED